MTVATRLTRRQAVAAFAAGGAASLVGRAGAQNGEPPPALPNRAPSGTARSNVPAWLTLPPTPSLSRPTRSGLAPVNGTSVFFAQFGEAGAPVLLLHGGLGSSNYWGHQINALTKAFSVTVMDTRGHGRSPVTSRSFSYGLFAQDVVGLLDFLEIPSAAIVGWSDGAITGLVLAMTRPERVSKLFAFGGNSSPDGLRPNGARSAVFAAYAARCKAEYAQLSPHPDRWGQLLNGLRIMWRSEPNFTNQKLASVKAPTMIADGEYDEIIKPEHAKRMADAIPGARLAMLPNVSHFAMLQNPSQFNETLMSFLMS